MARETPNVTILKSNTEEPYYDESEAAEALDCGDLVEEIPGDQIQKNNDAGDDGLASSPKFALEMRERGMMATDPDMTANDQYAAGDYARYITCDGGEHILANLAAGQSVTENTKLVSNGAGKLRAYAPAATPADNPASVVAEAQEALDNSGGTGFAKLRVEVRA